MRKVVITGMGVVSSLGCDLRKYWDHIKAGKSGIRTIDRFDPSRINSKIAGQVQGFVPEDYLDKRELRRMDLMQQFAIVAADLALEDSKLDLDNYDKDRIGVVIGSGIGGIQTLENQHEVIETKGPKRVSPFFIPMIIIDMACGLISIRHKLKGPNYSTVSACASAAHAISDALHLIQRGDADIIVSGGAEAAITELSFAGFCSARALSLRNDEPEKASRPFDIDRDGFVMGEGGAMLVLESEESALKRGARIYAEVVGAGMSADAYHMTAPEPSGSGATSAMKAALRDGKLPLEKIGYINTHGTSTPLGDISETVAIRTVFGSHADKLVINSTKSMIGHMLGAAGAIEAITTALSINEEFIHQTINIDNQDPKCDLDYVKEGGRSMRVDYALSNSFGFGGHNISLLIGRYENSASGK